MKNRKWIMVALSVMALGILMFPGVPAMAQEPPTTSIATRLEKLHPMSPEKEAAIVQQIPPVDSVIIDGVKYAAKDIVLFNGKRLHFVSDLKGQLYAFTSSEEVDRFVANLAPQMQGTQTGLDTPDMPWSHLFQHINFAGEQIFFYTNTPVWDFGAMNRQGSSLYNQNGMQTRLYDDTFFSGNSLTLYLPGSYQGMPYWSIWYFYSDWNDRACSGVSYPLVP